MTGFIRSVSADEIESDDYSRSVLALTDTELNSMAITAPVGVRTPKSAAGTAKAL